VITIRDASYPSEFILSFAKVHFQERAMKTGLLVDEIKTGGINGNRVL
jgi:hypothetical protein